MRRAFRRVASSSFESWMEAPLRCGTPAVNSCVPCRCQST